MEGYGKAPGKSGMRGDIPSQRACSDFVCVSARGLHVPNPRFRLCLVVATACCCSSRAHSRKSAWARLPGRLFCSDAKRCACMWCGCLAVRFTLQRLLVSLAFTSLFANMLFVLMPDKEDRCEALLMAERLRFAAERAKWETQTCHGPAPATREESEREAPAVDDRQSKSPPGPKQETATAAPAHKGKWCAEEGQTCQCVGGEVWYGHAGSHRWVWICVRVGTNV